jgi:aspartate-semialdehyde dehydrogenase
MRKDPVIAVVGATGLVGREMIDVLIQRGLPFSEIKAFASDSSAGELIEIMGDEIEVSTLSSDSFEGVDIALFATDSVISQEYVPQATAAGAVSIDNSSQFRMDKDVPLIVPEINGDLVTSNTKVIANPNCSTIQLCMALNVIQKAVGIERVVVSTYQSVSGAGKRALDELWEQSLAIFNQSELPQDQFPAQIAFNCIPQIDVILNTGYSKEEMKIVNESRKILNLPTLRITATTVRVPVFHSHAESVNVEMKGELSPEQFLKLAERAPGLEIFPAHDLYPMQIGAAGGDSVQVGRVRRDESVKHGLDLWIVSDNLRKGAAQNAVQIAELFLPKSKD